MSEKEFNVIFSRRLRHYLKKYNMTQIELANRLGVGTTSVYNWCNGIKTPRMDKIDAMCSIFNIRRSDLLEDKTDLSDNISKSEKDIEKILMQTQEQLTSQEGLMFNGEPASQESIQSILTAMKIGIELAKEKNKKYTPKKYIKD